MKKITLIASLGKDGSIGLNGWMPWEVYFDRKHFLEQTKGKSMIFGAETMRQFYDRFGRAFGSNRQNIVLSRNPEKYNFGESVIFASSPTEAVQKATIEEVFVCGGAKTYEAFMDMADKMILTRVDYEGEADTFFPKIDEKMWNLVSKEEIAPHEGDTNKAFVEIYEKAKRKIEMTAVRTAEQLEAMKRIQEKGICPFCLENFRVEHKQPFVKETDHWILTANQFPYEVAKQHYLLLHKTHIEHIAEVSREAWSELPEITAYVQNELGFNSGGFAMRFGTVSETGATISHIHGHFIQAKHPTTEGYEPVRFKIGGKLEIRESLR